MKRIVILSAMIVGLAFAANAARVDQSTAKAAALAFWNSRNAELGKPLTDMVDASASIGRPNVYLFVAPSGEGFVVVSADDRALPILGYSFSSPISADLPINAQIWFAMLNRQIDYICARWDEPTPEVTKAWAEVGMAHKPGLKNTIEQSVEPLLTTIWNQSPYYNDMCPFDSLRNARSVSGCTVTAMTQVMKYWNHPYSGVGSHRYFHNGFGEYYEVNFEEATYDWDLMPRALSASSQRDAITAVALITYHAGVAVEMNFSASASGSWVHAHGNDSTPSAENALWRYFKYNHDSMRSYRRDSVPWYDNSYHMDERTTINDDESWQRIIDAELLAARPILYTGYDSAFTGGHAFVCDGADGQGLYHFNWGWGGSFNGYYYLSNLAPGNHGTEAGNNADGEYNYDQAITVGIQPLPEQIDTVLISGMVCPSSPVKVGNHLYYTTTHDTVRERTTLVFVHLEEDEVHTCGFRAGDGEGSMASISSCPSIGFVLPECEFTHPSLAFIGWNTRLDGSGTLYHPGDTISARGNRNVYAQWGTPAAVTDVTSPNLAVSVGPNPTTDLLIVRCSTQAWQRGEGRVELYDALGRLVTSAQCSANGGVVECKIDVKNLSKGFYNVRIATPEGYAIRRIIKQ